MGSKKLGEMPLLLGAFLFQVNHKDPKESGPGDRNSGSTNMPFTVSGQATGENSDAWPFFGAGKIFLLNQLQNGFYSCRGGIFDTQPDFIGIFLGVQFSANTEIDRNRTWK